MEHPVAANPIDPFDFKLPGMDSRTLSEEGVEMIVRDTKGRPLKVNGSTVTLKLLGPDSDAYRALKAAAVRKRIVRQSAASAEAAQGNPVTADPLVTFVEDEDDALNILVACTTGWTGIFDAENNPVAFSKEGARALYVRFPVIREQVDAFTYSRSNFIKAS